MTILISAHQDAVKDDRDLAYHKGRLYGLLDNFVGMFVSLLVLTDPNIKKLEEKGNIVFWFNKGEEWGTIENHPKIVVNDIVVVVDIGVPDKHDFIIENVCGMDKNVMSEVIDNLKWEGYKVKLKYFNGNKEDEDESWSWRALGCKVMTFTIPLDSENFHSDNGIAMDRIVKCQQGLKRLINYLMG